MADETEGQNEVGEEGGVADYDANDGNDIGDIAGTTPPLPPPAPPIIEEGGNSVIEDYPNEDEPLPDFHVKLIINDEPDGVPVTDIVTAAITDELGNVITTTPTWKDAIDDYTATITQVIQDEVTGNGTTVGGKGWLGDWTWYKGLVVAFIALCIIGIILAVIFIIIRKPKNTNASAQATPSAKGKKEKKGVTQDPKYSAVPTNV